MKKYLWYFAYVMKHKWFVFLACWKRRRYVRGLIWRGIVHDLSKFLPSEFGPYARHFYGRDLKESNGAYKPYDTGNAAFDRAVWLHLRRNSHHWQRWIRPNQRDPENPENAALTPLPIPVLYCVEMFCDWEGAHRAKKTEGSPEDWWNVQRKMMHLDTETRFFIDSLFAFESESAHAITVLTAKMDCRMNTVGRK